MPTPILDLATVPDALERAADVLRRGGLVAFPTETVYGLGANALDAEAVAGIFRAKGRPGNNPLIVHVAAVEDVRRLVADWPDDAARLASRFWPGPLTLVLRKCSAVPDIVTGGGPTVAVRMPSFAPARELIALAGVPVAAPSANRSGSLSPTTAEHVWADLDGRIDLILDGGPASGGLESTVLDVSRRPARLLRPGLITPGEIEALIGPVLRSASATESAALPSPGMLTRHYAPRTPLVCVEGRIDEPGQRVAILGRWSDVLSRLESRVHAGIWSMPETPEQFSAQLYAALHIIDRSGHFDLILVLMPPDSEEWLAVRDRLRRAAAAE